MMAPRSAARRRPANRYHHGDLRQALIDEAVHTIQHDGIAGLTLRAVGERLRVSRTALYRHFADKGALLAAVAAQGFAMLRADLQGSWVSEKDGRAGFEAMGLAYVAFAARHPSHYRVMFGAAISTADDDLGREAAGAFQALVDAIVAQQQTGDIRADDPQQLARYIWALVHGIAMLGIDGQLAHEGADSQTLAAFALRRLRDGIDAAADVGRPSAHDPAG